MHRPRDDCRLQADVMSPFYAAGRTGLSANDVARATAKLAEEA